MEVKELVEEYQCAGCVCGDSFECYEKVDGTGVECDKHVAGTYISGIGKIFLGMPTGFCRSGTIDRPKIYIFEKFTDGWGQDKFNVPVWKHLDKKGNTLVRGLSPRINEPFIHIFKGNCLEQIDCIEITKEDVDGMD